MVTYLNTRIDQSLRDRHKRENPDREFIELDFGNDVILFMDNSNAARDMLRRMGREDLLRPLEGWK